MATAGAQRVAVTDKVLSPFARGANVVLQINDAKLLGSRSLTSAMCLAQMLAGGLAFGRSRGRPRPAACLADIDF